MQCESPLVFHISHTNCLLRCTALQTNYELDGPFIHSCTVAALRFNVVCISWLNCRVIKSSLLFFTQNCCYASSVSLFLPPFFVYCNVSDAGFESPTNNRSFKQDVAYCLRTFVASSDSL